MAPDVPFARVAGLVCGLLATQNAPLTEVGPLLGVDSPGGPLDERLAQYAQGISARLDAGSYAPPAEVFTGTGKACLTEWMSGAGVAVTLNLQKFMTVLSGPKETAAFQQVTLGFVAFAPAGAGDPLLQNLLESLNEILSTTKEGFLAQWDVEPEAERRKLLSEMPDVLMAAYGFAGALTSSLNSGAGGQDLEPSGSPMRREGRKIRPNEPCPCGSGRKYKKCHGAHGAPPLREGTAL